MAGLIFNNYCVEEVSYKKNKKFDEHQEANLATRFKCDIHIMDDVKADVSLFAKIGGIQTGNAPFEITAHIVGMFEYDEKNSNEINFEDYLSENAIAILFPYLRSVISEVSSKSNEFPTLILPIINVVKLLSDTDAVEIYYSKRQDS